jgi:hypothetical protein
LHGPISAAVGAFDVAVGAGFAAALLPASTTAAIGVAARGA